MSKLLRFCFIFTTVRKNRVGEIHWKDGSVLEWISLHFPTSCVNCQKIKIKRFSKRWSDQTWRQSLIPCSKLFNEDIVSWSASATRCLLFKVSWTPPSLAMPLREENDLMRSSSLDSASNLSGSLSSSNDDAFFTINRNVQTSTPVLDWNSTKEFLSWGTQSLAAETNSFWTSSNSFSPNSASVFMSKR